MEPECKRCGDPVELTDHALRDCPGLANVWTRLSYGSIGDMSRISIKEWEAEVMEEHDMVEKPCFAYVLWAIWYARNAQVFLKYHDHAGEYY